jgi:aminoglycoside phosphotransferase
VLNTLFWTFPRDPKIPGLAALAPNASGPATLGRVRHRLVRYVPEKRATAECIDPRGAIVAFVKAYSGRDDVRAARAHSVVERQLPSARPELRVPRLLAHVPDQGVIVVEAVPGQPLGGLSGADLARALRSLGVALATFHDLAPPPRPLGTPVVAGAAAEVVAVARPDLAAQARQLAAVLQSALPPAAPTACLHGDFHLGNALVDDDRASLLDIDHVCDGPAAHEIGETLARLCVWRLTGRVAPEDEVAGADAFREGYASARALPDPGAIRWHTARAFLARAEAGVKQLRPDLLGHLDELLAHGRAALEQTG